MNIKLKASAGLMSFILNYRSMATGERMSREDQNSPDAQQFSLATRMGDVNAWPQAKELRYPCTVIE
ncbi:hypothetical protein FRC01_009117 [Tulasnella sp. 417]|nr:hypothetical protein FRC01_009117 [Tulasnella sp. 417]